MPNLNDFVNLQQYINLIDSESYWEDYNEFGEHVALSGVKERIEIDMEQYGSAGFAGFNYTPLLKTLTKMGV